MASPTSRLERFLDSEEEDDLESGEVPWADEVPQIPSLDYMPSVVDYSTRGPGDWVVSGPIYPWQGRGRQFKSESEAWRWAVKKYGAARLSKVYPGPNRWAFLVRAERKQ